MNNNLKEVMNSNLWKNVDVLTIEYDNYRLGYKNFIDAVESGFYARFKPVGRIYIRYFLTVFKKLDYKDLILKMIKIDYPDELDQFFLDNVNPVLKDQEEINSLIVLLNNYFYYKSCIDE